MNYRLLGRTGLKVSELCLGTMTFGKNFYGIAVVEQPDANAMTARAIDAGINFFDTADVYSYGESETVLGQALKDCNAARDKMIVATKVRSAMSELATAGTGDINNVGLSRQHIFTSVEKSLQRLGTDYIDLYQVHGWDILTPVDGTLRALSPPKTDENRLNAAFRHWSSALDHLARLAKAEEHRDRAGEAKAFRDAAAEVRAIAALRQPATVLTGAAQPDCFRHGLPTVRS